MVAGRGAAASDVVERRVALLVFLIEEHRMALREGAALDVLAGQAHAMALEQERAEGERFGARPVDALAGLDGLLPVVEEAPDGAVQVEAGGRLGDAGADLLQGPGRDVGLAPARVVGVLARRLDPRPLAVEPIGLVRLVALNDVELLVELRPPG